MVEPRHRQDHGDGADHGVQPDVDPRYRARTPVNYNTDAAYGASKGFAPGSTFKPFTLAQWLKEGHSLNEVIDGRPMQYPMSAFHASCTHLAGPVYKFGNAEGQGAVMSVLDATRNSVNSGYIAMATKIDLCGMIDTAQLARHPPGQGRVPVPGPARPTCSARRASPR